MTGKQFIDPAVVEQMLQELLDDLEAISEAYTAWEQEFLESLEDWIEEHVVTDAQFAKLREMHEERMR